MKQIEWRAAFGGAAFAFGWVWLVGCAEPRADWDRPNDSTSSPPANLEIDAGRAIELDPGAGIGVAVAYAGDGQWQLTTSCDTGQTNEVCRFDILVTGDPSGSQLTDPQGVDLEPEDDVYSPDPFAVEMAFVTGQDLDGATFGAVPGATLRVDALLFDPSIESGYDWIDDPRMLSWVGHGAVNAGSPTNPVDLTPDQP